MIRFFRIISVLICVTIFGLGSCGLSFIVFPLGAVFVPEKYRRKYYTAIVHYSWQIFTSLIQIAGCVRVKTSGSFEDIHGKIIVASHPSLIDIVLLIGKIPNSVCIAKQGLMKNFIMRNIVKHAYILNGGDSEQFISEAKQLLQEGFNIVIFPTGTRTKKGEDIKIHKGAAQLAIASGVDIIPIKIDCDYEFLQKNKSMLDAGDHIVNYILEIQPAISLKDFDTENLTEIKLRNHISEKIKSAITQ